MLSLSRPIDTYGLATDRGLPARLPKLRDMASDDYNADTLYILAVDEAAAHRLTALAEAWGAEPHIYSQEDTARARDELCHQAPGPDVVG